MVSNSLVSVKDKPSEPELEENVRTMVWASASASQAESEDAQMSTGDLIASLREVSKESIEEIELLSFKRSAEN